jgi:NTE family protein
MSARVSLVLGSGGARGLAHIGAIRCLEDHGFEIGYISGCSIGALIGGIYAAGELDTYADWVCALQKRDVVRLLDWSFSRGAVFSGNRIIDVLKGMIGDRRIEDLPIGFTAVATELADKREVWLNKGSLFDAIRASIAVPLVFAPVERDGHVLVDGGLINPVPIAPTLNDPSALTIAVDLNGRAERLQNDSGDSADESSEAPAADGAVSERLLWLRGKIGAWIDSVLPAHSEAGAAYPSAIDLALASMDAMQTTIARLKLAAYTPRLLVEVPRNLSTFFEFHRAKELIDFGYQRTQETLERSDFPNEFDRS